MSIAPPRHHLVHSVCSPASDSRIRICFGLKRSSVEIGRADGSDADYRRLSSSVLAFLTQRSPGPHFSAMFDSDDDRQRARRPTVARPRVVDNLPRAVPTQAPGSLGGCRGSNAPPARLKSGRGPDSSAGGPEYVAEAISKSPTHSSAGT